MSPHFVYEVWIHTGPVSEPPTKVSVSQEHLNETIRNEGRAPKYCKRCKSTNATPRCRFKCEFYMQCDDCGFEGPGVRDYDDEAWPHILSWFFAVKRCHDKWGTRNAESIG